MGKSKKHKSKHISHDTRSIPTPPLDHSLQQASLIDGSYLKKSPPPQSPSSIKHFRHDRESDSQLISPQDVYHTPQSASRGHEKMQRTDGRPSMFPKGSTKRIADGHQITTFHRKQNEPSKASRQPIYPTIIKPPVDSRDTQSLKEHFMPQNGQRNVQHQTFTAVVPDSSDSEAAPDIPSRARTHGEMNKNSGSRHRQTKRESTSESEEESDTSIEGDANPETSDEPTAGQDPMNVVTDVPENDTGKHKRHSGQSRGDSQVSRALKEQELVENMKKSDKASMENAAKRAIYALTKPIKSENKNDRNSASTFNKPDLAALRSLQSLIPPHIQQRARQVVENQYPRLRPRSNNTVMPHRPEETDILHALTAAQILIVQLSATKLGGRSNTAASASAEDPNTTTSNSHLLAEVLRVLKDRDQAIQSLEIEVQDLRGQLQLMSERK